MPRRFSAANLEIVAFAIEKAIADGNLEAVARGSNRPSRSGDGLAVLALPGHFLAGEQDLCGEAADVAHKAIELNVFDWRNRLEISTVQRNLGETEPSRREGAAWPGRLMASGWSGLCWSSPNALELVG